MKETPNKWQHVTKDWLSCFPSLGRERSRIISRVVGPVVQSVILEEIYGASYYPAWFVGFLGGPEGEASRAFAQRLKNKNGSERGIVLGLHESEYKGAAEELRRQCPVSFEGAFTVDELIEAFYASLAPHTGLYHPRHHACLATFLALAGRPQQSIEVLEQFLASSALHKLDWRHEPEGPEAWLKRELERNADVPGLWHCVREQMRVNKLDRLPYQDLVGCIPPN